ncbi:hypothetical protein [Streptomyces canus]|uniref:hypothetical protein n=1 Tax=Streptomyces canus TaxID=58343 RepID=UPI0033ADC0FE
MLPGHDFVDRTARRGPALYHEEWARAQLDELLRDPALAEVEGAQSDLHADGYAVSARYNGFSSATSGWNRCGPS